MTRQIAADPGRTDDFLQIWHHYRNFRSTNGQLVTSAIIMGAEQSQTILVEAAMLITATRLRIARSMTLLAKVALEGVRVPCGESATPALVLRGSSHPPSAAPF